MKSKRGGKRPNAGRPKLTYPTSVVYVRVRSEFAPIVRSLIKSKVAELNNKQP